MSCLMTFRMFKMTNGEGLHFSPLLPSHNAADSPNQKGIFDCSGSNKNFKKQQYFIFNHRYAGIPRAFEHSHRSRISPISSKIYSLEGMNDPLHIQFRVWIFGTNDLQSSWNLVHNAMAIHIVVIVFINHIGLSMHLHSS